MTRAPRVGAVRYPEPLTLSGFGTPQGSTKFSGNVDESGTAGQTPTRSKESARQKARKRLHTKNRQQAERLEKGFTRRLQHAKGQEIHSNTERQAESLQKAYAPVLNHYTRRSGSAQISKAGKHRQRQVRQNSTKFDKVRQKYKKTRNEKPPHRKRQAARERSSGKSWNKCSERQTGAPRATGWQSFCNQPAIFARSKRPKRASRPLIQ